MHMYNMEGPIWVQVIDSMKINLQTKFLNLIQIQWKPTEHIKNTHTHLESIFCVILF